jgi:hypothetical protein
MSWGAGPSSPQGPWTQVLRSVANASLVMLTLLRRTDYTCDDIVITGGGCARCRIRDQP